MFNYRVLSVMLLVLSHAFVACEKDEEKDSSRCQEAVCLDECGGSQAGQEVEAGSQAGQEVEAGSQAGQEVEAGSQAGQEVEAGSQAGQEVEAGSQAGQEASDEESDMGV